MDPIQAVILAIVQGITEFLPISSSAHLILIPAIFDWQQSGLAFDVAVHVGTLLAVIYYLRAEIARIFIAWLQGFSAMSWDGEGKLGWMIIFATIPVGLVGLLFGNLVELHLRTAQIIAASTLAFGLLLGWADHRAEKNSLTITDMRWLSVVVVGIAQVFALIPGTSRSGVTITAMLALGFDRVSAAKFSFLLAIPAISLPGLLKFSELSNSPQAVDWSSLGLGLVISALVAFLCIKWFMKLINRVGMMPFVIYRVFLALGILLLLN